MKKRPTSQLWPKIRKGVGVLIALELSAFAGFYFVNYRMDRDREFRRYMKDSYPIVLETYYFAREFFDSSYKLRNLDSAIWEQESRTANRTLESGSSQK